MALSADTVRKYRNINPLGERALPVDAGDVCYRGGAAGETTGCVKPLSGASDTFHGFFSGEKLDNTNGADGALIAPLYGEGEVYLSVTGVTSVADENTDVYATDDNTFTLTSSGATAIGTITQWVTGAYCWVKFQAASLRSI